MSVRMCMILSSTLIFLTNFILDLPIGGRFDGECPSSHPVKIPEIQFFFRIAPYSGGQHIFSDGTSFYHADYFSGWNQQELQNVLVGGDARR